MSVIEIRGLRKRYGKREVVRDLTFDVPAGTITGFLGRNGAGKTTTLRMLLGLARPAAGDALVFGRPYPALEHPTRRVGVVLETGGFHPGRTGRRHLEVVATAAQIPLGRVAEVLEQVGLTGAAGGRVRTYSLGMRQRLALGAALLGRPEVLILDEPTNGLDPVGIRALREQLTAHAAAGGTVLVSSHQLAEVAQVVDQVVIIHEGRLVTAGPARDLMGGPSRVRLRTAEPERLRDLLHQAGIGVDQVGPDILLARGASPDEVGAVVAVNRVALAEMTVVNTTLEDVFLELTATTTAVSA